MKILNIKAYTFNELSDKAKQRIKTSELVQSIINNYLERDCQDLQNTFEQYGKLLNIEIDLDGFMDKTLSDNLSDMDAKRTLKYILNAVNFYKLEYSYKQDRYLKLIELKQKVISKYFDTGWKAGESYKFWYGKPFTIVDKRHYTQDWETGVFTDETFLQAVDWLIEKLKTGQAQNITFADFCYKWQDIGNELLQNNENYYYNDEFLEQELENAEYLFTENGNLIPTYYYTASKQNAS